MFSELIKRKGWIFIIVIVTMTFIFGVFIKNVGVESDIVSILPPNDPVVMKFKEIGKKYGGNTVGLVIVESDSVFTYPILKDIKELEETYLEIEGIGFTQSVLSMIDIKRTEWGIEVSHLIGDDIPRSPDSLTSIKNYILSKNMYRKVIISEDGRYTAIIVRIKEGYDRNEIGMKIRNITDDKLKDRNVEIYYSGIPLLMTFVNEVIESDLKRLMPITVFLVILVLSIGFRRPLGVILPVVSVIIASMWTIGSMGIFGKDFTLISNLMPVILIAVGSAYGIHVINRYYEDRDVKSTLKHISLPVTLAALTTIVGFLSFLTSGLVPIREFGVFSSVGVLASLLISLSFIPAVLYLAARRSKKGTFRFHTSRKFIKPLSRITILFKDYFIIIAGILFIITLIFSPTISRSADILEYFRPGSKIRNSLDIASNEFGGSRPILMQVKGDLSDPEVLNMIGYIQSELESIDYVENSQSIVDLLKETNYNLTGYYIIPDDEGKVNNLYFFLLGQDILDLMINDEKDEGLIQANLSTEAMGEIRKIVYSVEDFLDDKNERSEWYVDMLIRDLRKVGIEIEKPFEFKVPEVPASFMKERLMNYLESEEVPLVLKEREKSKVVKYALKGDFKGIENLGGEDGLYLERDIKTVLEDTYINYGVDVIYNSIVDREIDEDSRKRIKGDIYWVVKGNAGSLTDSEVEVIHTGFPRIHVRLDRKLLLSQFQSMGMAILLVFIILLLLLKSPQGALFSLIPIVFTVTLNFGFMELFRIPLDEATVMIAALAIGIGIDYVIHFTSRLKLELKRRRKLEIAIEETIETTGFAILVNAISVAVGFLALFGAQIVPLQRFGILVTGTMLVSSLSSITTLPALILRFKPTYIMRFLDNNGKEE